MPCDAGKDDSACLQLNHEQNVIGDQTSPGQDFDLKKSIPVITAMCEAMKSFHAVVWLRLGAGAMRAGGERCRPSDLRLCGRDWSAHQRHDRNLGWSSRGLVEQSDSRLRSWQPACLDTSDTSSHRTSEQ
jgi:hypothetical protein